jgi:dihydropteroate synthase
MTKKTKIMGILNITHGDSFFDSCSHLSEALEKGQQMIQEGADYIDVGGESSRPGAFSISEDIELERVIPLIESLHSQNSISLSIDTVKPRVARAAVRAGATMINDITGFADPEMRGIGAESGVLLCVMHMQGNPQTMQLNPYYPQGIITYLLQWFEERITLLIESGIKESQIILDPGIGFGKTVADNLEIIHNLSHFRALGFPLLLGVSRKSFIGKIVNQPARELLPATIAINTLAILENVDIIRVHDIRAHLDVRNVIECLKI